MGPPEQSDASREGAGETPAEASPSPATRLRERLAAFRGVVRNLPSVVRVTAVTAGVFWCVFLVLRIAFLIAFRGDMRTGAGDAAAAFYIGLKFDMRLALLVAMPVMLATAIPRVGPVRSKIARHVVLGYLVLAMVGCLFMYFADFGQYDYERVRLNSTALEHLYPLSVALSMVWQTYPVVWGALALLGGGAGFAWVVRRIVLARFAPPAKPFGRWRRTACVTAFVFLFIFGIYGKLSWFPLRWSEVYFSGDGFNAALGLNPVLFFFDTLPDAHPSIDEDEVRANYDIVADFLELEAEDRDAATLNYARRVVPQGGLPGSPNVVLIHLESFAAHLAGAHGNTLDATPSFDEVASRSLHFRYFYVPKGPTARSVFSAFFGLPDLSEGRTSSRNPNVVDQHTPLNALTDYEKLYFLGGSASWANIRGMLANNILGLRIYEEGHYDAPRADGWGISDLALFEAANEVFKEETKPFFAFIQTSMLHRPYTIPKDRRGFELKDLDSAAIDAGGFQNLKQYNAVRFLDHALGLFFRLAEKEPYFERTVFLMYGDHGVAGTSATPCRAAGLCFHHVPFAIYAPGHIKEPRAINVVASELDIVPTIMGLLGRPYTSTTLGRDLLVTRPPEKHVAFVHGGLLDDELCWMFSGSGRSEFFRFRPGKCRQFLRRYRSDEPGENVIERFPERAESMSRLYHALYVTARYMTHHNRKLTGPPGGGEETVGEPRRAP